MTLDEAVEKCAELSRRHAGTEAGREFGQMAGWLGEYRKMLLTEGDGNKDEKTN